MSKSETKEEYLQSQYVAHVELIHPMQFGKLKVSHVEITTLSHESTRLSNGTLSIPTDVEGDIEYFPESNVANWKVTRYEVPMLDEKKYPLGSYEYVPYTYPERVGGYLGSYSSKNGCIGFLDEALHITMMKDLK